MKILVTGWNGRNRSFIPKAVAEHLKSKGHEVHGWEWDSEWNQNWKTIYGWVWSESYKDYIHACPESLSIAESPLQSYDLVIHLGAISSTTETNVEKVMRQNFDFSLWLLNACQTYKIPLHYASSASVYGKTKHFQEEGKLDPKTPYAYSKYMFDRIVSENIKNFKSSVVGFRYFNVYGANEKYKGEQASVIYKWDHESMQEGRVRVFEGSENFMRDFIWVNDICEVHEKMLESDYSGILNLGTGEALSFLHVAKQFAEKIKCEITEVPFPEHLKCHYQKYTCSDNYKLNQLIDHKFTTVDEYFDKHY